MENNPSRAISISNGRQLFVDDYLIEKTDLKRQYHYPEYFPHNPILAADKEWEFQMNGAPYAAPFSDGIWYDEKDGLFKMWYKAGGGKYGDPSRKANITCYATSNDGIYWTKPSLDYIKGTNIVDVNLRDSNTIWLDKFEKDESKRFKMFAMESRNDPNNNLLWVMNVRYSADGLHWSDTVVESESFQDRTTVFYNPFKKVWVWSIRNSDDKKTRHRSYLEHPEPEEGIKLLREAPYPVKDKFIKHWFSADAHDPYHPEEQYKHIRPQIYNHDSIAYESLILGFFNIWQGPENEICNTLGIHKRNEVLIGYTRDGFHWQRPDRKRFLPINDKEAAWNNGNIQSVVGSPLIVEDELYFYCSARRSNNTFWDAYMSTGLAKMRRDGFVSLTAYENDGFLLTRILTFEGEYLFVNRDSPKGILLVEVIDESGRVIEGFGKNECVVENITATKSHIYWTNNSSLKPFVNKAVQFRFYLNKGDLYSFWVSKYKSGESGGFTAGGGPGLHHAGINIPIL